LPVKRTRASFGRMKCRRCPKPAAAKRKLCAACLRKLRPQPVERAVSRQRAWQKKQRAAGLCIKCGAGAWREGSRYCAWHRDDHAEKMRQRRAAGAA